MPVQINEVIIRAVVDSPTSGGHAETTEPPSGNTGMEAEVAEKIMEILKEKKER